MAFTQSTVLQLKTALGWSWVRDRESVLLPWSVQGGVG